MSKEEILESKFSFGFVGMESDHIYKAMDEYAKLEAIGFLNWAADNRWYRNGKSDEWYQLERQKENSTTDELYSIYQQQKEGK